MENSKKRTWAEISLDRLIDNFRSLRAHAGNADVIAIVKGNAYGNGAVQVALALESAGANHFAVAEADEAYELRRAGVRGTILILGAADAEEAYGLAEAGVSQAVYSRNSIATLAHTLKNSGKKLAVHLKIDTGMSRLGFSPEEAVDAARLISEVPELALEGVFTHFATADEEDKSYAYEQLDAFRRVLDDLEKAGIRVKMRHCSASPASLYMPEAHFDLIRPGLALYGIAPEGGNAEELGLRQVMTVKTRICQVKKVPAGTAVSYGRTFVCERDTVLAVAQIGYADGYLRSGSNKAKMIVRGKAAPVAGRICMDMTMLDVTDIEGVAPGDEVTVYGDGIPLDEAAKAAGTIPYELMTSVSRRVPRIYILGGREESRMNYIFDVASAKNR